MKISLLIVIILNVSFKTFGSQPVVFKKDNILIGTAISVLEDKTKELDIYKVAKSNNFIKSTSQTVGLPLSKSNFWLKFSVKNNSDRENLLLMIENSSLEHAELFFLEYGHYKKEIVSNTFSFDSRKYQHQNPIFDLNIPKDSTVSYFVKVNSDIQMVLPCLIGVSQNIFDYNINHDLFWGVLVGILSVMVFYNLFLFISTKDKSYLFYVLYTFFTLFTQITLSGYSFKYLFSDSPLLLHKALVVFPGLAGIFGIVFIQIFLQSKQRTPKLNHLFGISLALYSGAIIAKLINLDLVSYRLIDIAAVSTIFIIYLIAVNIALQGYRPAKFFLLAWSVFFVGLILFILRNFGILPYNFYTNYTMQIGTALEVTLLSLALADRINILKKEKEISQAEALEAAQENERIIKEQNVILEQKVQERTTELVATNDELSDTLQDLKETQSQLVASEKMASLGQLTAGIAHEINNPINFVTSNVSPLTRDVNQLLEALENIESIGLSEKSKEEKLQEIEDYKEDLDFDYLKIEIDHLLKGIHEGASRTAEIVKGLKVFSRLDEDDLKKADINECLDSTLVIMNSLLNSSKIKLLKEYGDIPVAECYPGKLNQVFLNIISNAIHAITQVHGESGEGELKITTQSKGEDIYISIKDNGSGMDEVTMSKIFDPFFTTKDVGEGTGLGMSIAYNTIKNHNGEILINSELGKGTEMIIHIPVTHQTI
ncbi:MAG TPA: 7TM diverse intracellular signaling domain-containing protein [Pelobium sp.]|nr:7TM diverse intracellular signaling domain-containing protein [Pelobium sp.]